MWIFVANTANEKRDLFEAMENNIRKSGPSTEPLYPHLRKLKTTILTKHREAVRFNSCSDTNFNNDSNANNNNTTNNDNTTSNNNVSDTSDETSSNRQSESIDSVWPSLPLNPPEPLYLEPADFGDGLVTEPENVIK